MYVLNTRFVTYIGWGLYMPDAPAIIQAKGVITIEDAKLLEFLTGMENRIMSKFDAVDTRLNALERKMDQGFANGHTSVGNVVDEVNKQVQAVNKSIDIMEYVVGKYMLEVETLKIKQKVR